MVGEDWDVLRPAMRSNCTTATADSFADAVHLFATNTLTDRWNWERLNLGMPVARLIAEHTLRNFTNASADRFRGLQPQLFLAEGARVFVNSNIYLDFGRPRERSSWGRRSHTLAGRARSSGVA